MPFGYNIVTHAQTEAGSLAGGFCGEEGLKNFVFDVVGYARAIVGDGDLYAIGLPLTPSRGGQFPLILMD